MRLQALQGLPVIGVTPAELLPPVVKACTDADAQVRRLAVELLGEAGPEQARPALPILADALKDSDSEVRLAAAQALEPWGREALPVAKWIGAALADSSNDVRLAVIGIISRFGVDSRPMVPVLIGLLEDADVAVVSRASLALGAIGGAVGLKNIRKDPIFSTIPGALKRLKEHESSQVQAAGRQSLEQLKRGVSR